ncbi:hypothetical protein [Chitinophaga rhizosphaerae]|uniref:hypothetical protein n=1 Tax=Chitinophaga rhizosphaerae TaxID=1864947 RepID=UPI000F812632|nr:hypothetical protein [Chitinophaga rhizosphaerae]
MNLLLRKIYQETLRDFVDFYRMSWIMDKWHRRSRKLPRLDTTDYFIAFFADDWPEDFKHRERLKAFEKRMTEYKKGRWLPNWWRRLTGLELLEKPVFKPFNRAEVEDALHKHCEARRMEKEELKFLHEPYL